MECVHPVSREQGKRGQELLLRGGETGRRLRTRLQLRRPPSSSITQHDPFVCTDGHQISVVDWRPTSARGTSTSSTGRRACESSRLCAHLYIHDRMRLRLTKQHRVSGGLSMSATLVTTPSSDPAGSHIRGRQRKATLRCEERQQEASKIQLVLIVGQWADQLASALNKAARSCRGKLMVELIQ
ncbi:hypothetical protein EJB05_25212, partial [Eragrostis curvula]